MENTSGTGARAVVPPEVDRWNWGAFFLNWIWGVAHNTFIALLMFVPLVNFVMLFVLGAKGSAWAWRNKRWDSVEEFRQAQRRWAIAGAVVWVGFALIFTTMFFGISSMMKNSDAYRAGVTALNESAAVERAIGHPIETGWPTGNMRISGPDGRADLSFSAKGPRGEGEVFVDARRRLGEWRIEAGRLDVEGTNERIEFDSDAAP
jgi:hypothetical protein